MAAFHERLLKFDPATAGQEIMHAETLKKFNDYVEQRQRRLLAVSTSVPPVMWIVVLVGALMNITLVWLFDMRFTSHLFLGGMLEEQLVGKPKPEPIEVGVLFSQTGPMSISEMPVKHAVIQAIDEINAEGGVLGRPLVPVIRDGRSREEHFEKRTKELTDLNVAVIFGGWRSIDRKATVPIVERSGTLLFYPLQYEGNESSKNVFYGGMTPNQQILPALDWFMSPEGGSRKRVFLIGTDYVYPRTANYVVRKYLEDQEMQVVGEEYIPFDQTSFEKEFAAVQESQADLILSTINGEANVPFFRTFANMGFDTQASPILATSIGESGLRSIPSRYTTGHYASWTFFQSLTGE